MKKLRSLLIVLLVIFCLAAVGLVIFNFFVPKASGLLIETSPASTVYIDGEEVGRTPYTSLRKSGEMSLRLIPDSFGQPLAPFEEKINLVSGVETVVRRYFGSSEIFTEGEILSFEKLPSKSSTGVTIISDPENVQIEINGVSKGATPYTSTNIESGVSKLKLTANGYKSRELEVSLIKGYKLISFIKLSKVEAPKIVEEVKKEVIEEKLVRILKTPTGFLRVRNEASSSAQEVGQVKPGEEYKLLGEDEKGEWFKIFFKEGITGWVTGQYSEIVMKSSEASSSAKKQ